MDALMERAVRAGRKFLERSGYEILDEGWKEPDGAGAIDLVAEDIDGTLVFVDVSVGERENGFGESPRTRAMREASAAGWLYCNGAAVENGEIRFDDIALMIVGERRAFLRHTLNSLCGEGVSR